MLRFQSKFLSKVLRMILSSFFLINGLLKIFFPSSIFFYIYFIALIEVLIGVFLLQSKKILHRISIQGIFLILTLGLLAQKFDILGPDCGCFSSKDPLMIGFFLSQNQFPIKVSIGVFSFACLILDKFFLNKQKSVVFSKRAES